MFFHVGMSLAIKTKKAGTKESICVSQVTVICDHRSELLTLIKCLSVSNKLEGGKEACSDPQNKRQKCLYVQERMDSVVMEFLNFIFVKTTTI